MKPLSFVSVLCSAGLLSTAWCALTTSLLGADVQTYLVQKGIQYIQSGADGPVPDANNGAIFEARIKSAGSNLVTSVTMRSPSGASAAMPQDAPDEFKLKEKYDKQSGLDSHFPNGTYTFSVNAAQDGLKTLSLGLTGDLYPNTPRLSNYAAAQQVDAGAYFVFAWDSFTAGGITDFVQLHIEDNQGNKVFETPDFGEDGALDGRALSVLVPAGTFTAGQTYQATLYFAKAAVHDLTSYPGALGAALYYKRTKFPVQTTARASETAVKIYGVSKMLRFQQTDPGPAELQTTKAGNLDAVLTASNAGAVSNVTLGLPGGGTKAMAAASDAKSFEFSDDSSAQSGLDASYPNGVYQFQIVTTAGNKSPALNLTGDAYPAAPHIQNLGVTLNPSTAFSVAWDPFTGGNSTDFVQLHIEDTTGNKIFETPDFGKSGALTGLALSAVVPKDALLPGRSYNARVVFQKNVVLDTTSYPGALGFAAYVSRTGFKLTTTSAPGQEPPTLAPLAFSSTGDFRLRVQGVAGQKVQVETSADLRQWTGLSTNVISASGQWDITDDQARRSRFRYYRAVLSR